MVQRHCISSDRSEQNSGLPFTRDELIDQLGVFFLLVRTTASALTWVFYILAERPEWRGCEKKSIRDGR